ncbi:MAG: hypothetical protein C0594_17115 [Marinilabiliales bacterium]|nr:MAG: hypothetical protein C0594_17115 [Marinilabiliales bacterium]
MKVNLILIFLFCVLLTACKNKTHQTVNNDSGLIEISKSQFESEKMVIGSPKLYPFADKVHCTGAIIPSVDGQAEIGLPLPGIINRIHCKPAQKISKGSVLFEISGHWFIDLQKDFSESSAILSKLKGDFLRAKELHNENIGSEKEFTAAESKFNAENAKYKALETKLENMGIDVAKIERGEFYSSYPVKSPIGGFVSSVNASVGEYIEPNRTIAKIIDNESFHLRLSVFEKDIHKIKTGQSVNFYLNGNVKPKYHATVSAIGKTIMADTKSIECFADIGNPDSINMVSNQFVEGEILTAVDSVLSIPETAIIESENELYVLIYVKEENSTYYFKKKRINSGRKANNYIELAEQLPSKKLLVNGVYNIVIE